MQPASCWRRTGNLPDREELRLGSINLFELRLQRNQYIQAPGLYTGKYHGISYKIYNFYTGVL
jgi:hypothetical protein